MANEQAVATLLVWTAETATDDCRHRIEDKTDVHDSFSSLVDVSRGHSGADDVVRADITPLQTRPTGLALLHDSKDDSRDCRSRRLRYDDTPRR